MRSSRLPIQLGTIIAMFIMVAGLFGVYRAQAGTGLTIQPIKISQTLKAGDATSGTILLSNASPEDVAVDITIQDFIPLAGADSFQFVSRAPGVTTVRDWITIKSPTHFVFKPNETKQIPYSIVAPKDAEPGSHFGVIFFKATRVADLDAQIKVGTQVGVLTFVTVPGKFEQKGNITDLTAPSFVQTGPVEFDLTFENTGTVHFEPKGSIDITNMFGSKIASVPIEGYAVLPTGVKKMNFAWRVSGLLLGKYNAVASVYDLDGNLLSTKSVSFFALPIWYAVGFIVVILIIFLVIWFFKTKLKISVSLKK